MKKEKNASNITKRRKNARSLLKISKKNMLLALILVVSMLFVACSAQSEKELLVTETEATTEGQELETVAVEEVEPTPQPTLEPTPEPTPEPVIYEGVDMESTLPGLEWIKTLIGIIDEPKFIVFNDETNKKVIVENEQEVTLEEGDIFIVFLPEIKIISKSEGINIESTEAKKDYYKFTFERQYFTEKETFTVEFSTGEVLTCKVIPKFD